MTPTQLTRTLHHVRLIMTPSLDLQHGCDHLDRVWANAQKLAAALFITDPNTLRLLQAAVYLHDLSTASRPPSLKRYFLESRWTVGQFTPFLEKLPLPASEITLIQEAVLHHHLSIPWRRLNRHRPLFIQILEDADSIDYFHPTRLAPYPTIIQALGRFGQRHIHWFLNQPQTAAPIAHAVYSAAKFVPPKPSRSPL